MRPTRQNEFILLFLTASFINTISADEVTSVYVYICICVCVYVCVYV